MRGGFDLPFERSNFHHCMYRAHKKKKGEKSNKRNWKNVRKCEDELMIRRSKTNGSEIKVSLSLSSFNLLIHHRPLSFAKDCETNLLPSLLFLNIYILRKRHKCTNSIIYEKIITLKTWNELEDSSRWRFLRYYNNIYISVTLQFHYEILFFHYN